MTPVSSQRLPFIPTLLIVTVLGCLGVWQMQRLQWKEALLADIAAAQAAPPINLNENYLLNRTMPDYQRVTVRGRFDHAHEFYIMSRVYNGKVGLHVVTPLTTDMGQTYLINRGWVPPGNEDPATRPEGQVAGDVQITGMARRPAPPSRWQPANDVAHNHWYTYDLSHMYLSADIKTEPLQFYIDADATPNPGGLPAGSAIRPEIANNHLQYALTWYGLGALIALIFAADRLKRRS